MDIAIGFQIELKAQMKGACKPTRWDQDVFDPSSFPLDTLIMKASTSDFAVFIASPDDVTRSRGAESASVRDNVIFEFALFAGIIGLSRTYLMTERGTPLKLPSDINGLTQVSYDSLSDGDSARDACTESAHKIATMIEKLGCRTTETVSDQIKANHSSAQPLYEHHHLGLDFLVKLGPIWLAEYRGVARQAKAAFQSPDAWDRESVEKCAHSIYDVNPGYFGESRRSMLTTGIGGVQVILDGMVDALNFFDPAVAMALALFPAAKGIRQLQPPPPDLPDPWQRDAHIIWELLEASRRLYAAMQECAPDVTFKVDEGSATLSDGSTWNAQLGDITRDNSRTS